MSWNIEKDHKVKCIIELGIEKRQECLHEAMQGKELLHGDGMTTLMKFSIDLSRSSQWPMITYILKVHKVLDPL